MADCLTHILPNGLRMIYQFVPSKVSYAGFAVNTGSRDEEKGEEGLAHFVEHLLFKGTLRRNVWHILNRMENVGGELNAYTAKEETVIYSVFLSEHFSRGGRSDERPYPSFPISRGRSGAGNGGDSR